MRGEKLALLRLSRSSPGRTDHQRRGAGIVPAWEVLEGEPDRLAFVAASGKGVDLFLVPVAQRKFLVVTSQIELP